MLKLDRSLTQAISVKTYRIKIFRSDFRPKLMYMCWVSLLITLDIYKAYFKGRWACKKCPSSLFFLKKLLRLYAKVFVTKELPNLHCWWTEELCSQKLFKLLELVTNWDSWKGVCHVLGSMHHWLVTYWDSCIKGKDCRYNTNQIGYWGKGSTIGWYFGIGQRVW